MVDRAKEDWYWLIFAIDDENYRYCFAIIPGLDCPFSVSSIKKLAEKTEWEWPDKYKDWADLKKLRDFRFMCVMLLEAVHHYWEQPNVKRPVKVSTPGLIF